MFCVGDKVVYPMYGAGVIESIEDREIHGQLKSYYIMKILDDDMNVMIPVNSTDEAGLRHVVEDSIAHEIIRDFKGYEVDMLPNWTKRYRENMLRLKDGDIVEVAKVVKGLMVRDKERGLSTGEKKMLNSARHILISELILSLNDCEMDIENAINFAV